MSAIHARDSDQYLRLAQFLDLQSRWLGSGGADELAHRICQTIGLLMETCGVELELCDTAHPREGRFNAVQARVGESIPQPGSPTRALATTSPQLASRGEMAVGSFPFVARRSLRGCLRVAIPRAAFSGAEVLFLRFVASLAGLVLASTPATNGAASDLEAATRNVTETDARRYVAMAVHDLRNPLNVISGYSGLLADGTLGGLSAEQDEAVDAINRQLTVLLGLVDRLIDFDRLARAETSLTPTSFNLRDFFDELSRYCFPSPQPSIAWPGEEANFYFCTDRRRLFSIVQNLVDNALKHGGGKPVQATCTRRDGRLLIAVIDEGPGLSPATVSRLTNRDAATRIRDTGSGLGLFTVTCYVKALSGRLDVRSGDAGGTLIEVSVPALPIQRTPALD